VWANATTRLWRCVHAKRFLIGFRNENVAGQVQATKARTLIGLVGERAEGYATRYRQGRAALVALKGVEAYPNLRELKAEDMGLDGDWGDSDAAARKKLAMIGAGRGAREPRNAPGTSKRVMSWIWTAGGALEDAEAHLHDCECVSRPLTLILTEHLQRYVSNGRARVPGRFGGRKR
jgi:hypothetical protein